MDFSEWKRILANPMAAVAATSRVAHHFVSRELALPSYRTDAAQWRGQEEDRRKMVFCSLVNSNMKIENRRPWTAVSYLNAG